MGSWSELSYFHFPGFCPRTGYQTMWVVVDSRRRTGELGYLPTRCPGFNGQSVGGRTNRSYARKRAERVRGSSHPPGHRGPCPSFHLVCVCCHPRAGGDAGISPEPRRPLSPRTANDIGRGGYIGETMV